MSRLIPEALWRDAFLKPDGRYDGHKFEGLALDLLERLYGAGWRATATSHDGSRDYEKRDPGGWLWAECKAYSERLSIYVLSPTLVMALLEQPHTIIILSRSRLNDNAVRHLSTYQASSGKIIAAYDEDALDHAIISTDLYNRYFPGLSNTTCLRKPKLQARCYLSQDALSAPSELDIAKPPRAPSNRGVNAVRFGLLRLDVIVRNPSSAASTIVTLEVQKETIDPSLRVIAFGDRKSATTVTVTLPPGGLAKVNLILQPSEPKDSLSLPRVSLIEDGVSSLQLEFGSIHVSNLYQIELVGATHRRIVADVEDFLHHRRRSVFVTIEGASGTGKSRILQEIAVKGLEHGFRCHFYNPELEDPRAAERITRSLLADLCDLPPNIESFDDLDIRGTDSTASPAAFVAKVLYDRSFSVWDHTTELVDAVIDRLARRRTLLIIDNVQFASETFVEFIDQLTSALAATYGCRAAIVLCFNSDYDRPESRSAGLLAKLRGWSADTRGQWNSSFYSQLAEFTRDDVADFVERALSGDRNEVGSVRLFQHTLGLLTQYVQPRPLNLWQSLMYLADEGILVLERGQLLVRGDATLSHRVQSLPSELQALLLLRWARIKANENRSGVPSSELEATLRAAYILGHDSQDRLLALGASERAISDLMRAGILSADAGGRVRFFHQQLFIFARGMYLVWESDLASELKNRIERLKLGPSKFQSLFILAHFSREVTGQLVSATIRHMAERGLTPEYWQQYTRLLLGYLMSSSVRLGSSCLQGITLVSEWEQRLESLDRGATTLSDFLTCRLLLSKRSGLPGNALFHFYQQAINGFLSIYDDSRALEVIDIALRDLDAVRFQSPKERQIASAKIFNRRAATLKNFGRIQDAEAAGREALSYTRQAGCRSLEVETLFDVGSVLLRAPGRRNEAWALLEEACQLFDAHQDQMVEPAPCRQFYVRGQIALLDHRFDDTYRFCSQGVAHCKRLGNHFWGVRLLTLEVVARLAASVERPEESVIVERLLTQAWDWLNVSHAERSRWSLSYLQGKYLVRAGEPEEATNAFADAISSLVRRLRTPEQVEARIHILHDIAASCRRHRLPLSQVVISMIPSDSARTEMLEILEMTDRLFLLFEDERRSDAFFCYAGEIIELP